MLILFSILLKLLRFRSFSSISTVYGSWMHLSFFVNLIKNNQEKGKINEKKREKNNYYTSFNNYCFRSE